MNRDIDPDPMTHGARLSVTDDLDCPDWDRFVSAHPSGHHVQSTPWARLQAARAWEPRRWILRRDEAIVAACQVLVRDLGWQGRIAYIDRGPLVDHTVPDLQSVLMAAVREDLVSRAVRAVVAQPPSDSVKRAMLAAGFRSTDLRLTLPATVMIDLHREPDQLLSGMKAKTRYNVRKGLRSELDLRQGDAGDAGVFAELLATTAERQGFQPNSPQHIRLMLETLGPDHSRLFIAEDDEGPISAILVVAYGDSAVYKRGAWSGRAGNRHPNELLHWTAMQWARAEGYKWYDFDGIERPLAEIALRGESLPSDALSTVTRFKLGFGGDVVLRPETLIWLPNRLLDIGYRRFFQPLSHTPPARRLLKGIQTRW